MDYFISTQLVFTAVFGNNLETLAASLAPALGKRASAGPDPFLTIITCENFTNAAATLKNMLLARLSPAAAAWLIEKVGFSESMVLRTCLDAGPDAAPLTIRAQNYFELPCDGDALKEDLHVYGLKPPPPFCGSAAKEDLYL